MHKACVHFDEGGSFARCGWLSNSVACVSWNLMDSMSTFHDLILMTFLKIRQRVLCVFQRAMKASHCTSHVRSPHLWIWHHFAQVQSISYSFHRLFDVEYTMARLGSCCSRCKGWLDGLREDGVVVIEGVLQQAEVQERWPRCRDAVLLFCNRDFVWVAAQYWNCNQRNL